MKMKDMELGILEQSGDDDYQAMLCFYLEKRMRELLEPLFKDPKTSLIGRKLIALEMEYRKEGLSWREIIEIRRKIIDDRNGRPKTIFNKTKKSRL